MTTTLTKRGPSPQARSAGRGTLADDVVRQIRREIVSGRLAPGTMLAEIPTALRLDVSRVPVREAMLVLEQDGLLVFEDNGRCRVRTLSARDFHEIYGVRLMLESEAFRLAALHRTDADLRCLRENIRQMGRARSLQRISQLDSEFHSLIVAMGRQSRLLHLWKVMSSQLQLFTATLQRELQCAVASIREVSVAAHDRCLRGIETGDPEFARSCAIEHLEPWDAWLKSAHPEGSAT